MNDIVTSRLAGIIRDPFLYDEPYIGQQLSLSEPVTADEVCKLLGAIPIKSSSIIHGLSSDISFETMQTRCSLHHCWLTLLICRYMKDDFHYVSSKHKLHRSSNMMAWTSALTRPTIGLFLI
jgi:hypothetical protein